MAEACTEIMELSARKLLHTASFLGFLHYIVPGGFCRLKSGREFVDESREMEKWRGRSRAADCLGLSHRLSGTICASFFFLGLLTAQRLAAP